MKEILKKIIYDLEKKQGEIEEDVNTIVTDAIDADFANEDFVNGYIKGAWQGIEKSIEIVKERQTTTRTFFDYDAKKLLTEEQVRKLFFEMETQDLFNNSLDYINGFLDLQSQFRCIEFAKTEKIEKIIDRLGSCWSISIEEIKI